MKEILKEDKLKNIKLELGCINYFKTTNDFIIHKAFDGCKADIIAKPKEIKDDLWIGIQVKTTETNVHYEYNLRNDYNDCLLYL